MPDSVLNPSFSIELDLKLVGKANNYEIIGRGRHGSLKSNDKATTFKTAAMWLLKARCLNSPFSKQDKLKLTCEIRFDSYRADEDIQLLKDALQRSGVIHNDRQIREVHTTVLDAKGPPRIRLKVERIGRLPWDPR